MCKYFSIIVKKIGFQTALTAVCFLLMPAIMFSQDKENPQMDKYFEMSLEELMDVEVVTASKTSQKVSDIPASTIIVTRDEIEKHGYHTIDEVLQNITGLYGINDYGEGGMMFGVRGFWSGVSNENIIIMINNIPQTKNAFSSHPTGRIFVPVEAVDRIEIIRGPMSIIYGSGAFFGAINIITSNSEDNDNPNIIAASTGSAETQKAFLRASSCDKDYRLSFNAGYYKTDGIDQPLSNLMSDLSDLSEYNVSPDYTTGGTMSMDHKYFDLSAAFNDFYLNLVLIESMNGSQFNFPSFGDGHKEEVSDYSLALGYRKAFGDKFSVDSKITFAGDRSWWHYSFYNEDFYGVQQIESKAVELTTDLFYKANDEVSIQAGLLYKSIYDAYNMYDISSFDNPFFDNNEVKVAPNSSIRSFALYSQVEYKPIEDIRIVGGLRLEQSPAYDIIGKFSSATDSYSKIEGTITRDDVEIIPRLAVIYKLNKNNIVKLLYGKAINRPSFFQDYVQSQSGQDILKSQEIETFELNFQTVLYSDYMISINAFHNEMDNLITRLIIFDDNGNYDYSYNANAGRMSCNGAEISITAKPTKGLHIDISATLQETTNKKIGHEDIELGYSPKHLGYTKIRYDITDDFTAALNIQYVSEMETFWDDSPVDPNQTYSPIGRIGKRVDGYTTTGVNLRYKNAFMEGLFVNLKISNLFDTEIRYPAFTNNSWADKGTLGYKRRALLSIGYKF